MAVAAVIGVATALAVIVAFTAVFAQLVVTIPLAAEA